jgi:glutathione S-transferase
MTVELYHFWSSVCSVRARMALEEKGVKWVSRYIDLFRLDQLKPEYLALNPDGVVPTLVHDGNVVRESAIIIEYVDDAFPGPALKPKDPLKLARMRLFMRQCEADFPAVVLTTMAKYIVPKLKNRMDRASIEKAAERRPTDFYKDVHGRGIRGEIGDAEVAAHFATLDRLIGGMEEMLAAGGPWLLGEYSLADIFAAPYMFRLLAMGQEGMWAKDKRPLVHDWYARISQRPAFATAVNWPDETGGGYEEVGLTTRRDEHARA